MSAKGAVPTNPLGDYLKQQAKLLGFDICRVTAAADIAGAEENLAAFVGAGYHGTMAWIETTARRRGTPGQLWPQARSVVVVGANYGPQDDPLTITRRRDRGAISVYARNRDYHGVLKGWLKTLAGKLVARGGGEVKVFVDTAPVMEKPIAARAGVGWQGKHTNLVSRDFGSWLFLGVLMTTLELDQDRAEVDHCGNCRACLDACPTNAFPAPYQIDARRCISYLTIEHAGPIDREFRAAIGNRIYGCDDCLAVCPWNKFASTAREIKFVARDDLTAPGLSELSRLDDAGFRTHFSGSPIKRIGRDRFVRNVAIAIGNSAMPALAGDAERLTRDRSALVRGAAIWALARLVPAKIFSEKAAAGLAQQDEPDVRAEWLAGPK